ncbi:MAG: hypothetical protein HKO57_16675, partial [Akkermansiaceae bacterium]|nr:hypothetical protein [Akkermansiaceae bacterium]
GDDATGWLGGDGLWLNDHRLSAEWREPLEWKNALLLLSDRQREWMGMQVRMSAALQPRKAMNTKVEVQILQGALAPLEHPKFPGLRLRAAQLGGLFRLEGPLKRPSACRAHVDTEAAGIGVTRREGQEEHVFDSARLVASYRGGVLQVPALRLVSEQISFLGNGLMLPDGRAYGILRIVAELQVAEAVTRVAVGSGLTRGWAREWMWPLVTPDRYYRDLHIRGRAAKLVVDVGRRWEEMSIGEIWKRLEKFYNREKAEDQRGLPPSPPREEFPPAS